MGPDRRRLAPRLTRPGSVIAALLLLALAVQGATTWTSDSAVTLETTSPPVTFAKGDNADDRRWFRSFDLSTNATSFTAEVKPRAGSHVYIEDVAKLASTDDEARTVTLTGTHVSNAKVERFEWEVFDGVSHVGQLDHKDADPSTSFSVPGGNSFRMDLEIDLADGAGRANAGITFEVQLEVT